MPNCGSDWFAGCIHRSQNLNYFREFFNPITNRKYSPILEKAFGCESITSYQNIANFDYNACKKTYEETWLKERFNFTKENYSAFKIEFFKDYFDCIALIRDIKNVFPPKRPEVYYWYDAIYAALNLKEKLSMVGRSIAAFNVYKEKFIEECEKFNIKIIKWESLVYDSREDLNYLGDEKLIDEVIKTRIPKYAKLLV